MQHIIQNTKKLIHNTIVHCALLLQTFLTVHANCHIISALQLLISYNIYFSRFYPHMCILTRQCFVSCVVKLLPDDTVVVATHRLVLSLVHVFVELTGITHCLPRDCWTQDGNYFIICIIQLPLLGQQISFYYLSFSRCILAKQIFHRDTSALGN